MLDILPLLSQPKNVTARAIAVTRSLLVAVKYDIVSLDMTRLNSTRLPGYSCAIGMKYAINASLPI